MNDSHKKTQSDNEVVHADTLDRSKGNLRRLRLLSLLSESPDQGMSVNELADIFGVSVATVRRDLAQLEDERAISRTYGGAAIAPTRREMTMAQRELRSAGEKRRIGKYAASMLKEGDVVILDAGSTSEQVAAAIDPQMDIAVITNGLRCISQLVLRERARVLVMGGNLRGVNETICGPDAEAMLKRVFADYAFIGADAVDHERGVASRTYDQSRLKTLMMRQAVQVFVIADSSKLLSFDEEVSSFWSELPRKWGLITDIDADPTHLEILRGVGADPVITV